MILIGAQAIIFGWFYGVEKVIPYLNEFSTIKMGKKWIFIIKYILPILLIAIWIFGLFGLVENSNLFEIVVDLIITVIVVSLSILFTKINRSNNLQK